MTKRGGIITFYISNDILQVLDSLLLTLLLRSSIDPLKRTLSLRSLSPMTNFIIKIIGDKFKLKVMTFLDKPISLSTEPRHYETIGDTIVDFLRP